MYLYNTILDFDAAEMDSFIKLLKKQD